MAKVGVILSGCGVFDGSEIHEAVITLLCLGQRGAEAQCLAPNRDLAVVDHQTKQPTGATRNVLTESARIARGDILDLATVNGADFDALVLPGGFGAAKNLCTFAIDGADCELDPETSRVLTEAQRAGRPIGFACIAPAVAAKTFGALAPTVTIGHDAGTAAGIEALGARHEAVDVDQIVVDTAHRIVSTPAYMEAKSVAEVYTGIDKLVAQVIAMAAEPAGV